VRNEKLFQKNAKEKENQRPRNGENMKKSKEAKRGPRTRRDIKKIYCLMISRGVTTSGGKSATVSVKIFYLGGGRSKVNR